MILTMLALVCASQILSAVPARPGKFTRTLPDGRKVTLQLHGDEFRHWMTDESGRVVKEDKRGNLVPSSMAEVKVQMGGFSAVNRDRVARLEKTRRMMRKAAPTRSSDGSLHFPMILVQFSDLSFKVAKTDELVWEAFNNLANEVGYSAHGGTGSIHDYYVDNSMNQTDFYFDVYGPVTVSGTYADYGANKQSEVMDYSGEPAAEALMEAVRILAAEKGSDIFNPYDNDGDGWVDAVFMYYAGHNQAEGGPEDTIWPHEWSVDSYDYCFGTHYSEEVFGNVRFGTYSCSSELKGSYGINMCGIGTAVHEFGHALGLPDLTTAAGLLPVSRWRKESCWAGLTVSRRCLPPGPSRFPPWRAVIPPTRKRPPIRASTLFSNAGTAGDGISMLPRVWWYTMWTNPRTKWSSIPISMTTIQRRRAAFGVTGGASIRTLSTLAIMWCLPQTRGI